MSLHSLFPTRVYQERLWSGRALAAFHRQLLTEIEDVAALDEAGRKWSRKNYHHGFTSYASANQLHRFSPSFAKLEKKLDLHVAKFARALEFDLGGRALKMTNCWVNVMETNTQHSMHLHPLSVISGTYYVQVPAGSSGLKFEDPRLGLFMATPPRKERCRPENKLFCEIAPVEGGVLLFESWLKHEVPAQPVKATRISVSFNYGWGD